MLQAGLQGMRRFAAVSLVSLCPGIAAAQQTCGDVDCSGSVLAGDALQVLRTAVGIDAGADCVCEVPTTSTTLTPDCAAIDVQAFTTRLAAARCVAYAPSGNWNPETGSYPSGQSVAADLALLKNTGFDCIVTYGSEDVLGAVPCLAKAAGFTLVVMGLWNPQSTVERNAAVAASDCADAYSVGNEGLTLPYCCGAAYGWDTLVTAISSLRAQTCRPVTTSEPSGAYFDGIAGHSASELRALGDWVFPNAHPYFAGKKEAAEAVAWTVERYQTLVAASGPSRFVMLKEVGLPSAGDTGLSEENQKTYYSALQQTSTEFFVFEAFDQAWKHSLPVEPNWGAFRSDRSPKAVVSVLSAP